MCSFLVWKNACLNYREFDLEGDLVGVPHTWYLSAQSFITLLKLVWREYDIVSMNEWKKKCVGLQRTWVSKRTVNWKALQMSNQLIAIFRVYTSSCSVTFWLNIANVSSGKSLVYACYKFPFLFDSLSRDICI